MCCAVSVYCLEKKKKKHATSKKCQFSEGNTKMQILTKPTNIRSGICAFNQKKRNRNHRLTGLQSIQKNTNLTTDEVI